MKNNIFKTENKFAREQKQLNKGVAQKFEIKEIVFVKSLIDWAKNNDEDLLKKILIQFTDIPVKKTIDFMKIFNKEKEFKRLLEKYSSGII